MTELLTGVTLFAVLVLGVMALLILRRSSSADDPRWHELGTRMDALNKEIHALREVSNALSGAQEKRLESLSTQIQLTLDSVKKDMGDRLTHMGQTAEQSAERIRNVLNEDGG